MKKFLAVTIILAVTAAVSFYATVSPAVEGFLPPSPPSLPVMSLPDGFVSAVFVESTDGTDDGITRLVSSMSAHGLEFYQTERAPDGLIASNDVVLLKFNVQWGERGGTNTDLIARVIEAVLAHPDGFTGEIIVGDNGQGIGRLDWARPNSACREQSVLDVVNAFQARGDRVTASLWDEFSPIRVAEFSEGDYRDGFVAEDIIRHTGLEVTYPKFTTEFGTRVSFRHGIWNGESYDVNRLRVINMPVLKSHWTYWQTGAVKNYMGVVSNHLTRRRAHYSVGTGGMGTQLVYTRMPVLHILDMIWVTPDGGPASSYTAAVEVNKIGVSLDPVALDVWATNHVLIPEAERLLRRRPASMSPSATDPGTFGHWLRLSLNEMLAAGYNFTMDEREILVVINGEN